MFLFSNKSLKDNLNILIVDDNSVIIDILTEMIDSYFKDQDLKYKITTFPSVDKFLKAPSQKYDISLIDWNIGKSDVETGSTVVKEIKDSCSNISIVSGQAEEMIKIAK